MFAPKLYTVYKIPLHETMAADYNIDYPYDELRRFKIHQQDSGLLRQIRLITGCSKKFNPYIVFVNIDKKDKAAIERLVYDGFYLKGRHFLLSERSASMTRTGILSFVDAEIEAELNRRVTMDIEFDTVVMSKYFAYRGLQLSACHNLEGFFPKMIVVPDLFRTIPKQHIKYATDVTTEFVDKDGNRRSWTQKAITSDICDIEINIFDGAGIIHPALCREIEKIVGSKTPMSSMILRAPYIKGLVHEIDYPAFFAERGIHKIKDIWGEEHDAAEPMIILTEGMYKGLKYFKTYGDARDWELYWKRFHKYNHCLGIAKWNFTAEEEPIYTRGNYQILQDLDLPYDKFRSLADYSIDWAEKVTHGDPLATYCFLGLYADKHNAKNNYIASILKNPQMIKEQSVKKYVMSLLSKYKDDMKCGKLWLNATFKFMAPDLIMLMEHIGGLEPVGCLEGNEFYSHNRDGAILGERLIERNPHICRSEHTILIGVQNELINTYCSHLDNVCMINGKSIVCQKLNGADYDGDLCFLINNETMMEGVDRYAPVVLDMEDKITALAEKNTKESRFALIMRTINSLIGEISNTATCYASKTPKDKAVKNKYNEYIDLLSILNGKAIDCAKTGIIYQIPKHIAKYSKPLPYFMKYASEYYGGLNKFSHANSNMNRLCKDIERWCKTERYTSGARDFDYNIMIDDTISVPEELQNEINKMYVAFNREMADLARDQMNIRKYGDESLSTYDARNFSINWGYYYENYKQAAAELCSDKQMLANAAVRACYEFYANKKNSKFMWAVAGDGILENIKQVKFDLPIRDDRGAYDYLGNKYSFAEIMLDKGVIEID